MTISQANNRAENECEDDCVSFFRKDKSVVSLVKNILFLLSCTSLFTKVLPANSIETLQELKKQAAVKCVCCSVGFSSFRQNYLATRT